MDTKPVFSSAFSRRAFLGAGIASLATIGLAACSGGGGSSGGSALKFWDMVWGTGADYTAQARSLAGAYAPTGKSLGVSYQSIPWANWYQTFASAVASKTGPAVSTGASFQPFYFMDQGAIAPADDVVSMLQKDGKADFLPGTLEAMKTSKGYAALPWSLDLRVLWYRTSFLDKAEVEPPTDWDSFITAGTALKKRGIVGLGLAAASSTTDAQHSVFAIMINNGGGMFAADGTPDCVTDRNIETLDFLHECVAKGIIDPAAASYSQDNLTSDWKSGHVGMGFGQTGLDKSLAAADRADLVVGSPLSGPHGDKGTVYYINPLMMYTNTPSQDSSNEFTAWWMGQIGNFWSKGTETDLPVLTSITKLDAIQSNPNLVKSVNEWQPIGKTIAAQSDQVFGALNSVDGGQATAAFVQQIVQGTQSSRQILETLQTGLEKVVTK